MVGVAQLAERQVVVLDVVGSSPITHPSNERPVLTDRPFVFQGLVFQAGSDASSADAGKSALFAPLVDIAGYAA